MDHKAPPEVRRSFRMVYLGNGLWGDIYLSSDNGSQGLQSKYNANPITGTEGLNWYIANEKARRVGKRLPTYAEFCQAAAGSPEGQDGNNTYAWSATETLDARKRDMLRTLFRRLISAILWVTSGSGLMNFVWILRLPRGTGTTYWARAMVTPIFRQIPHFTRSLAAAVGPRRSRRFARGLRRTLPVASAATLACGACVTRSKQKGRPKGQPLFSGRIEHGISKQK